MRFILTEIEEIVSKKQHTEKYQSIAFPSMKFSREKKRVLTLVLVRGKNQEHYLFRFEDGRKANSLYVGKEIWGAREDAIYGGLMKEHIPGEEKTYRLDYWWESKAKFLERVKKRIARNEETIEYVSEENKRLRKMI